MKCQNEIVGRNFSNLSLGAQLSGLRCPQEDLPTSHSKFVDAEAIIHGWTIPVGPVALKTEEQKTV